MGGRRTTPPRPPVPLATAEDAAVHVRKFIVELASEVASIIFSQLVRRNHSMEREAQVADGKEIGEGLQLLFDTATDTRKFEIDLFWKRSLFFWGFIAAAFTGYVLATNKPMLALAIACFGLVCSVVWTLSNRGSKYWQETWEAKVERIEDALPKFTVSADPVHMPRGLLPIQPLFRTWEPPDTSKGRWLRGRQFSVSKLTIALSDFTSLVWLGLMVRSSALIGQPKVPNWRVWTYLADAREWGWLALPICSLVFLALAAWAGGTTRQGRTPKPCATLATTTICACRFGHIFRKR